MSAHWAMQRWTFGAGRVALRAEPYRGADAELGLWHGFALASREWSREGNGRLKLGASALALLLAVWITGLWVADVAQKREEKSGLEIVMLEAPPPPAPVVEPEPEPIVEPEPVTAAPEPEPILKPEPPKAKPKPAAKPERVAPPPAPKPVQVAKPAPPPAPRPRPQPAPPVQVARPALPAPPPVLPTPTPASVAPAPRVQASRPALPKPVIAIDAVKTPVAPAEAAPRASQPARLALRPAAAPARPRPAPSFDLGAPAAPAPSTGSVPPAAASRAAPTAAASKHASARSVARPPASLALPALSTGASARDPGVEPTPVRVASHEPAPPAGGGRSRTNDPKLRGVALGSLASCVSDKEEDALKLQLVSLVSEPTECVSSAGRYRFVETRNLNAFLLWVERAPARPAADRCVELTHALACVRKHRG